MTTEAPDMLLVNARVHTMDPTAPVASSVGVTGGRISFVGADAEARDRFGREVPRVDLSGRTVVPGLIESHVHPHLVGLTRGWVDCRPQTTASIADIVTSVAARVRARTGDGWVRGYGYDDTLLAEERHPTRHDLDQASRDVPIFVTHVSGHFAVANSEALRRAGVTRETKDPDEGRFVRDAGGEPTGLLWERGAIMRVDRCIPQPSDEDLADAIAYALSGARARGITSVHDLALGTAGGADGLRIYESLERQNRLPVRVRGYLRAERLSEHLATRGGVRRATASPEGDSGTRPARFRLAGVKFWADGSIQGLSAALREPYLCAPESCGDLNLTTEALRDAVGQAHAAGLQVAIHANGDRAVDAALDAVEAAVHAAPRADHRHRIEHAQVVHREQLDAMRRIGVVASFFVNHVHYWGDRHRDKFLGAERAPVIDPLAEAQRAGVHFGIHSDSPVTPMDPLLTWWVAVNRRTSGGTVLGPEMRISPEDALRALTSEAAYLVHDERSLGRLRVGYLADLVVLGEDPFVVDPDAIRDVRVEGVMVDGSFVHDELGVP